MSISVACVVGPSVNTLRIQLIIFKFLHFWEFSTNKIHPKKYLSQFISENYDINFIKFDSPKVFFKYQEHPQIPMQFSNLILFIFSLKKWFSNQ